MKPSFENSRPINDKKEVFRTINGIDWLFQKQGGTVNAYTLGSYQTYVHGAATVARFTEWKFSFRGDIDAAEKIAATI